MSVTQGPCFGCCIITQVGTRCMQISLPHHRSQAQSEKGTTDPHTIKEAPAEQKAMQADGLVPRVRYIGSKDSGRLATATATASADLGATATATGAEAARRSSERTTASGWMSSRTLSGSGRRTPAGGRRQRQRQVMI